MSFVVVFCLFYLPIMPLHRVNIKVTEKVCV